ncbi:hypothetical protein [Endozoicomonas elysicola]|uniref:Uncharacterized protein n=1 Tax=Endozoicomonas elysicola TaxID=305900 RepID=A0A081KEA1_9GAMM|nr:hypothetical protein [Endozoicomonas elysicola]KEI72477.1 hypothetical protein GV64_18640 [Endozoicomonas elysicola]
MSKYETWRTRQYWHSVGGYLIEEFHAIKPDKAIQVHKRAIDGIIVLGIEKGRQAGEQYDFQNKDIIVVQTKKNTLGMHLMGQAYFSAKIMERFQPKSIKSVAICGSPDSEMQALCDQHNIEVIIIPESDKPDN